MKRDELLKKVRIPFKIKALRALTRILPTSIVIRYIVPIVVGWAITESFRVLREEVGKEKFREWFRSLPTRVLIKDEDGNVRGVLDFPAGTSEEEIRRIINERARSEKSCP